MKLHIFLFLLKDHTFWKIVQKSQDLIPGTDQCFIVKSSNCLLIITSKSQISALMYSYRNRACSHPPPGFILWLVELLQLKNFNDPPLKEKPSDLSLPLPSRWEVTKAATNRWLVALQELRSARSWCWMIFNQSDVLKMKCSDTVITQFMKKKLAKRAISFNFLAVWGNSFFLWWMKILRWENSVSLNSRLFAFEKDLSLLHLMQL